ncbi:MAG: hypothetical protein K6F01_11765 [Selenomonas sp.]|uniref:hypothetical protein n=1 Tax=Selenomonas sp. TaxID=2053611 RepID=UPI0025FB2179|nr:hypothetical protein [Selenomonas sp.]MCR5440090.1 hypothetical protein [Selenomonas sp.]
MKVEKIEQIIEDALTPDINNLLYDAIAAAVDKGKMFEAEHPEAESRTVSSFIHDAMCAEVEKRLPRLSESPSKVSLLKKNGTLKMLVDNGRLVIRFKKMTRRGLTSNIVTQSVLEFEQMSLFADESVKLNAGYCYTHGGIDYEIVLSHPNGIHSIDWCQPIIYNNVEPFVTKTPAQNATRQGKRKLLPRKDAVKHAKIDKS